MLLRTIGSSARRYMSTTSYHFHKFNSETSMMSMIGTCGKIGIAGLTMTMYLSQSENMTLCDNNNIQLHQNFNQFQDFQEKPSTQFSDFYESTSVLGKGSFGVVKKCIHKAKGTLSAVKVVPTSADAVHEQKVLSLIKSYGGHKNIVKFEGYYTQHGFSYICLEYIRGNTLWKELNIRDEPFTMNQILNLSKELISALYFLHDKNIVHSDLKPDNIMLTRDNHVKLLDFGCASIRTKDSSQPISLSSSVKCYLPPECLLNEDSNRYNPEVDMWSLGCVLYSLVSQRHPFDPSGNSSEEDIIKNTLERDVAFDESIWENVPKEYKVVIKNLLAKDPSKRMTASELREHPLFCQIEI